MSCCKACSDCFPGVSPIACQVPDLPRTGTKLLFFGCCDCYGVAHSSRERSHFQHRLVAFGACAGKRSCQRKRPTPSDALPICKTELGIAKI
eukprot:1568680-Amphidinium_carterae.1